MIQMSHRMAAMMKALRDEFDGEQEAQKEEDENESFALAVIGFDAAYSDRRPLWTRRTAGNQGRLKPHVQRRDR